MNLAMVYDIRTGQPLDAAGGRDPSDEERSEFDDERDALRGLSERDRRDVERWSGIAATLVRVGWRTGPAWSRANDLADECAPNDPMPHLYPDVPVGHLNAPRAMSPASQIAIANIARAATERMKAKTSGGARDGKPGQSRESASGQPSLVAAQSVAGERVVDGRPPSGAPQPSRNCGTSSPSAGATASASATRVTPREQRVGSNPAGGTTSSKEEPMSMSMAVVTKKVLDQVVVLLKERGPMSRRELRQAIECTASQMDHALDLLRRQKTAESNGWASGARWRLVGDLRDKPSDVPVIQKGTPAAKALEQRPPAQDVEPRERFTFKDKPDPVVAAQKAYGQTAPTGDWREQLLRKRAHHAACIEKIDGLLALEEGTP